MVSTAIGLVFCIKSTMARVKLTCASVAPAAHVIRARVGFCRNLSTTLPWTIRTANRKAADAMDIKTPSGKRLMRDPEGDTLPRPKDLSHIKKSLSDSLVTTILPFGSDPALREQYINAWGNIRVGMLFEEIDAFAGQIAYLHCDDGDPSTGPLTLVTASMDRLDLLRYPLPSNVDLMLRGAVTYTGTSSMNIDVDLCTFGANPQPIMQASTTFVARGLDEKAVPVPVLVPNGPEEQRLYEAGKAATEARKRQRKNNLLTTPPTPEELRLVHNLFTEMTGGTNPDGHGHLKFESRSGKRFGDETIVTTTELTQPTDKNVHGKVFGGFLLRKAFECAFAAAWRMTGSQPKFLALDDVSFLAPVEVGTLLRLDAQCNYAQGAPQKTYSVTVSASMQTPGRAIAAHIAQTEASRFGRKVNGSAGDKEAAVKTPTAAEAAAVAAEGPGSVLDTQLTNLFHFTFYSDDPLAVPKIYPRSYGDALAWVGAHRRQVIGKQLAEERKAGGGPQARFPQVLQ